MKLPLRKTLRRRLETLLIQLGQQRAAILAESDADAIHDFRVAVRCLLPALGLLFQKNDPAHQMIQAGWKSLRKLSGQARDAEIVLTYISLHPANKPHLPVWQDQYLFHRKQLAQALESPGIDLLLAATGQALLDAIDKFTKGELQHQLDQSTAMLQRRLHKQIRRSMSGQQDWHAVRLDIKTNRYWYYLTCDLVDGLSERQAKRLEETQTALGNAHDLVILTKHGLSVSMDEQLAAEAQCHAAMKKLHRSL